jgi:hypothetical protein
MQRNKVHHVTVICEVAKQLRVKEDLLHAISLDMDQEDGVIWVYGVDDDGLMAFTDEGIDELKIRLEIHREHLNV